MFQIRPDDLTDPQTRALLALHLSGMHAHSPADAVFALDLSGLQSPDISVWTLWDGMTVAGVGALRTISADQGEIKSMRTHPDHLRKGVAAALLRHIIATARAQGMVRLSLETGRGAAFEPALALYRAQGFVDGDAFGDYADNGFSQFLHRTL
ncbi:GNAT family N-acetyltransferase [Sphingobium sp. CR2-8]|uniref:GNAT family N-acetyltransferase n=1 Tax=Sphingobium sp. CR2-8 TaxID=1306534 RepID=UPI002DBC7AE3|nr:GNAT family N-acetyltransferase [Sphingobium sp. CR2-8]MEC3910341.1 GNAT family N-acetyltransferase [Sphingobium sp. CR2-8]